MTGLQFEVTVFAFISPKTPPKLVLITTNNKIFAAVDGSLVSRLLSIQWLHQHKRIVALKRLKIIQEQCFFFVRQNKHNVFTLIQ